MGKRQEDWARRRRITWIEVLGGKCVKCGSTKDLEFDVIISQGDKHHKGGNPARMCFYHAQIKARNLQLLCSKCNGRKGHKEGQKAMKRRREAARLAKVANENEPF